MNFFSPKYLSEAFEFIDRSPDSIVICGGLTHLLRFYKEFPYGPQEAPESVIHLGDLVSLDEAQEEGNHFELGAALRINELTQNIDVSRNLPSIWEAARNTSIPQIRNRRTLGGEIAWGSFHSPLVASLMAMSAEVKIRKPAVANVPAHEKTVSLDDLYEGELLRANSHGQKTITRKPNLGPRDLILKILISRSRYRRPGSFCFVRALQPKISTENSGVVVALCGQAQNGVLLNAQYVVAGQWIRDFKDELPFEGTKLQPSVLFEKLYTYFERYPLEQYRRNEGLSERQLGSVIFGLVKDGFSDFLGLA